MSKKSKLYSNSYGKSKDISEKFLIFIVMENCRICQKNQSYIQNSYGKSKDISEKFLIFIVMENLKIFQKNSWFS